MAKKERFAIEGLSDLQVTLRELPDTTAKAVLRRVGRKVLQPVADHARSIVREDTGTLKESIGVSTKLTRRQKRKHRKKDRNDVVVFVGAGGLTQAITEEFGTVDQAAHPFMRPAWDANRSQVIDAIGETLATEIDKSARRLAKKLAKAKGTS